VAFIDKKFGKHFLSAENEIMTLYRISPHFPVPSVREPRWTRASGPKISVLEFDLDGFDGDGIVEALRRWRPNGLPDGSHDL
jgi:hypothetical protein